VSPLSRCHHKSLTQVSLDAIAYTSSHSDHANLEYLLHDDRLIRMFYDTSRENGIIVVPTGSKRTMATHPMMPDQVVRERVLEEVEEVGFDVVVDYLEAHSPPRSPQSFIAIMKGEESGAGWLSNEAEVSLRIRKRTVMGNDSGTALFRSFDGATMMTYKFPSRIDEEIFCRSEPKPKACIGHGFDPEKAAFPASAFEARHSGAGEQSGRGVFAKERVSKGSYIGIDDCVNGMNVPPFAYTMLKYMLDATELPYFKTFALGYLDGTYDGVLCVPVCFLA